MEPICTKILGNYHQPEWQERLVGCEIEYLDLDQWMAQKSRFLLRGNRGGEYAVALEQRRPLQEGDILFWHPAERRAVVVRLGLSEVLVIDLAGLASRPIGERLQRLFELGHAIGNQHWPAVIRDERIYLPLTMDRRVMLSVLDTHRFEGVTYAFHPGSEVIPYLAPYELRRLFGGAEQLVGGTTGYETHHH